MGENKSTAAITLYFIYPLIILLSIFLLLFLNLSCDERQPCGRSSIISMLPEDTSFYAEVAPIGDWDAFMWELIRKIILNRLSEKEISEELKYEIQQLLHPFILYRRGVDCNRNVFAALLSPVTQARFFAIPIINKNIVQQYLLNLIRYQSGYQVRKDQNDIYEILIPSSEDDATPSGALFTFYTTETGDYVIWLYTPRMDGKGMMRNLLNPDEQSLCQNDDFLLFQNHDQGISLWQNNPGIYLYWNYSVLLQYWLENGMLNWREFALPVYSLLDQGFLYVKWDSEDIFGRMGFISPPETFSLKLDNPFKEWNHRAADPFYGLKDEIAKSRFKLESKDHVQFLLQLLLMLDESADHPYLPTETADFLNNNETAFTGLQGDYGFYLYSMSSNPLKWDMLVVCEFLNRANGIDSIDSFNQYLSNEQMLSSFRLSVPEEDENEEPLFGYRLLSHPEPYGLCWTIFHNKLFVANSIKRLEFSLIRDKRIDFPKDIDYYYTLMVDADQIMIQSLLSFSLLSQDIRLNLISGLEEILRNMSQEPHGFCQLVDNKDWSSFFQRYPKNTLEIQFSLKNTINFLNFILPVIY